MSKEETVEVTIKVPKRLMEFLEDQNYFGWGKEQFFVVGARHVISGEVCEMPFDEMKELEARMEAEYGEDFGIVDMALKKTLV